MSIAHSCRICWAALLMGLALVGQAPRVWAANTSSTEAQVEARRSEAKRWFSRGVEHYRAARYPEAVSAFLEADKLVPSPALSFNIARAYEQLGGTSSALRWYRDYLRRDPGAHVRPHPDLWREKRCGRWSLFPAPPSRSPWHCGRR